MTTGHFKVEFTQGAEDDLGDIHTFMSEHRSKASADSFLDAFLDKIETLERYPERGGIPKELDALGVREFRQIILDPYRVIYRVVAKTVFIVVIADGRRDLQALLERRLLQRL